jgi:hypothetical protein
MTKKILEIDGKLVDINTYQQLQSLHLAGGNKHTVKKLTGINADLYRWVAKNIIQINALQTNIAKAEAKAKEILGKL